MDLAMQLALIEHFLLRVLYLTVWKNLGMLNDDFFCHFLDVFNLIFSSLFVAMLLFINDLFKDLKVLDRQTLDLLCHHPCTTAVRLLGPRKKGLGPAAPHGQDGDEHPTQPLALLGGPGRGDSGGTLCHHQDEARVLVLFHSTCICQL